MVKPLASPPVLHEGGPAMSRVAETMGEYDSGGVPSNSRDDETGFTGSRHGSERAC